MAKNSELVIIEDNPADYALYVRLLDSVKHDFSGFRYLNNITAGIEYLQNHPPKCCLTDFRLPDGSAKDLLQKLITATGELKFPVVVATGQENNTLADELNKLGVQDFLIKGKLTGSGLARALQSAVSTFGLQKELYFKTHYDSLSGFSNRTFFFETLDKDLRDAQRFKASLCLVCIQIQDIRSVYDNHSRESADTLVKLIGENIKPCVDANDTIARLSEDEFAVVLRSAESHRGHYVAQKLLKKLAFAFPVAAGLSAKLNPFIGLAVYNGTAQTAKEFFNQAHIALQQAKRSESSEYKKYLRELDTKFERKKNLESEIVSAVNNETLHLNFLPIYSLDTHEIYAVEALARWTLNDELIEAKEIIELCSTQNLTINYHDWLFKTAFSQLNQWRASNPSVKLALNITAKTLNNKQIIENLFTRLYQFNLSPKDIILDIAETQLMHQLEETRSVLNALSSQGIHITIDNFGSGFSSVEYIASLSCNALKIDQRFLLRPDVDVENTRIVKAIVALAHALELEVIAEGVANKNALALAQHCGCNAIQGHLIGTPLEGNKDWHGFIKGFDLHTLLPTKQPLSATESG